MKWTKMQALSCIKAGNFIMVKITQLVKIELQAGIASG